jgi:hypothetical protein
MAAAIVSNVLRNTQVKREWHRNSRWPLAVCEEEGGLNKHL